LIRLLKRFAVSKLKDAGFRQQFVMQVRNRFAALDYIDEEIITEERSNLQLELNWEDVVHTYTETSGVVLGQKKKEPQRLAE